MLAIPGAVLAAGVNPASAAANFTFDRLAGQDRFGTAAAIATGNFTTAATVVIANGEDAHTPDALAANSLAGAMNAPILLSTVTDLPSPTQSALTTLKPTKIVVIGGTAAVSDALFSQLQTTYGASNVTRVAGVDRFATAIAVAEQVKGQAATVNGKKTAIVANAYAFVDSIVASPIAYSQKVPVLLTGSSATPPEGEGVTQSTLDELKSLGIQQVLIFGGTGRVPASQETALKNAGYTTVRIAGTDRAATAVEAAKYEYATFPAFLESEINLARGDNPIDALVGGVDAGRDPAPILLTIDPNTLGQATEAYLKSIGAQLQTGTIYGGTGAVSTAVQNQAEMDIRGSAPATVTALPELTSAKVVSTVTSNQVTPTSSAGTTISFTFDEQVNFTAPTAAEFYAYASDGTRYTGDTANNTSSGNSGSNNTVNVFFNDADLQTTAGASALTTATVGRNAVVDAQGFTNPEGDTGLNGTSSGTAPTLTAGRTSAPDLVSVGNFRQGAATGETAVDFTFDQAAFAQTAAGFHLILPDGTDLTGTGPTTASTTPGSGGTSPGGNGTTTFTVTFPARTGSTSPLTASDVARAYITRGTVSSSSTSASAGQTNPAEAVTVSNNGQTIRADLVSTDYKPDASTTADQVIFTFDQPFSAANSAQFFVLQNNGDQVAGSGTNQINTANNTQVAVNFPKGTLTNAVATYVGNGAVTTSANGQPSQPAEVAKVGSTGGATGGQAADRTQGPDLTGVSLSQSAGTFGAGTFAATYTFDSAVTLTSQMKFHLYEANGDELTAASCTVGTGAMNATVTCSSYNIMSTSGGSTNNGTASSAQIGNAVLGTVEYQAVTNGSTTNPTPNPEGAEVTTGGTGTPSS